MFYPNLSLKIVYFIVFSCSIYICNLFEGQRVISVLGLLLSVLPSLNKAYYYFLLGNTKKESNASKMITRSEIKKEVQLVLSNLAC